MHSKNFHSQLIRPPFPRGSRLNKIRPRGNPAIVRSIPAVFPQHSYSHPRETRGFRGIPAVPIPVHTSTTDRPCAESEAAGSAYLAVSAGSCHTVRRVRRLIGPAASLHQLTAVRLSDQLRMHSVKSSSTTDLSSTVVLNVVSSRRVRM